MATRIKLPEARLKELAQRVHDAAATLLQHALDNDLQLPLLFMDYLEHEYLEITNSVPNYKKVKITVTLPREDA